MATATLDRPFATVTAAATPRPSGFIVSPLYDTVFFILSPLLALGLGIAVSRSALAAAPVPRFGTTWADLFIGSFTMAHLSLVFFRSHGNPEIFKQYPRRFTLVPALLFASLLVSTWARAAAATLAIFWDVYHSGLQTFGLGRIYDRLAGNDARVGRRLDLALNHLLYAGPIVAGTVFLFHVQAFYKFESVGSIFFTSIPARARVWHGWLALGVIGLGVPFLLFYLLAYVRLARRGYRVSPQKVGLLVSTALCSIYTWGFDSFGRALFIMNFFHALQYFALVGYTERKGITQRFRLVPGRWLGAQIAALLVALGFGYGLWATVQDNHLVGSSLAFAAVTSVSLLHFWYDGFIWSVRKKQV